MRETPRQPKRSRSFTEMTLVIAGIAVLAAISGCAPRLEVQANSKNLSVAHSDKPLAEVPHMKVTVSGLTTDAILVVAIQPACDDGGPVLSRPLPGERYSTLFGDYVVARVGAGRREIPIDLSSKYFKRPDPRGRKRLGWEVTALVVKDLQVRSYSARGNRMRTQQIVLRPEDVPWEVVVPWPPGPDTKSQSPVGRGGRFLELKGLDPGGIETCFPADGVLDRVEFPMP